MTERSLAVREEAAAGGAPAKLPRTDALTLARNIDGLMALGRTLLKSGLLPDSLRTPEAVVAVVIKGQELDVPPMHALSHIVMVKGKPTMSAELMRALVLRAGHKFRVVESTAERATVEIVRRDDPGHPSRFSFTEEDARRAGLLAGNGPHKTYPAAMKLARATSAACRAVVPDAISGISHTPEELGAEVDEEGRVVERAAVSEIRRDPRSGHEEPEEPEEAEVVEDDPTEHDDVLREVGEAWRALPEGVRPDGDKVLEYARRDVPHARETLRKLREMAEADAVGDPPDPDEVEGVERGGARDTDGGRPAGRAQMDRLIALANDVADDGDGEKALESMVGVPLKDFTRDMADEWFSRLSGERS